jgi:hypothetical protein
MANHKQQQPICERALAVVQTALTNFGGADLHLSNDAADKPYYDSATGYVHTKVVIDCEEVNIGNLRRVIAMAADKSGFGDPIINFETSSGKFLVDIPVTTGSSPLPAARGHDIVNSRQSRCCSCCCVLMCLGITVWIPLFLFVVAALIKTNLKPSLR